jgi:large subunit ribosomal protein L4
MPKVSIHNIEGTETGTTELPDDVFGVDVRPHLFYEVVKWQLANRRSGTASTKTRAEIRGSTSKPFRQKGTGNARRGSGKKSPLFPGGGIAHGPRPKDWGYSIPKKLRKAALRSALTKRLNEKKLFVIDDLSLDVYKSKKVLEILGRFGLDSALLVDGPNEQLDRSARNLTECQYLKIDGLNVYDVLRFEALVISVSAIEEAAERLKP